MIRKLKDRLIEKAATVFNYSSLNIGERFLRGYPLEMGESGVQSAYKASAIAYACIRRQAQDAAGIPLLFLNGPDEDAKEVPDNDPVRLLFDKPNRYMSTDALIEYTVTMQRLRGEWFWMFDWTGRTPREIYPYYDPQFWTHEVSDNHRDLTLWRYEQGQERFIVLPRDMLHHKETNPYDRWRGQSPLLAATRALQIDIHGDTLQAYTISQGGEGGSTFITKYHIKDENKYEQMIARLAARKPGNGQPARDWIIDGGLELVDPKFTRADMDVLAAQGPAADKICFVYGMAPVLIGDDDAAQFKSAPEAIRLYWRNTMKPLLRGIESSWDKFFIEERGLKTHVRFDLTAVKPLQDEEKPKAELAKIYWDMGLPFAAINEHCQLGFDDDVAAEVDEKPEPPPPPIIAPPDEPLEDDEKEPEEPPEDEPSKARLLDDYIKVAKMLMAGDKPVVSKRYPDVTLEDVRWRALKSPKRIQRARRLGKLEAKTRAGLRNVAGDYKKKMVAIIENAMPNEPNPDAIPAVQSSMRGLIEPLGDALMAVVGTAYVAAAKEGVASVVEMFDDTFGPMPDAADTIAFQPKIGELIKKRGYYIRKDIPLDLIETVNERVREATITAYKLGQSGDVLEAEIKHIMNGFSNNAKTIARTELNALYNAARFEEMGEQGVKWHEWITSIDEFTRDGENSEFNHVECDTQVVPLGDHFKCGLAYPHEDGGEPGNVINCRCETIPALEPGSE